MRSSDFTPEEMMIVTAARALSDKTVCFVGIGMPSTAANLARLTHAPDIVLVYESGTIGAKPPVLPLSIGDGDLALTADTVVSTPEIFRYWLQGRRIHVGFLGAAQLDRFANINTTVIGSYEHPKVRLPGAGGAPEIAASAHEVFIIIKQNSRSFVEQLDFITSVGYLGGGDDRTRAGLPGRGPTKVITDLGVLEPESGTNELTVTYMHPGITPEKMTESSGWELRFAENVHATEPPRTEELRVLRELIARTRQAHGDTA